MNTLFLAQRVPYPPNKGEKIRTYHQIRYLLESGHRVSVASPYENLQEKNDFDALKRQLGVNSRKSQLGFKAWRYLSGLFANKPLSVSNFYCRDLQKTIDQWLLEEAFDNIVCTSSSMAEYVFRSTALTRQDRRPRLVMDFMDLDSDKWRQYSLTSAFPRSLVFRREANLMSRYEREVFRTFDHCLFISEAEVELFCARSDVQGEPPLAIGNGIDTDFFVPSASPPGGSQPIIIFTGVMNYKPNIDAVMWFATRVWPDIQSRYPQARFIVAGMKPVAEIRGLAGNRGVEVTGFVEDILPYYHQSNIFVAPLRIARGVQNKVLQSFACGIPVVSTSMGAEGIDCVHGKDILIADTSEQFIEKIERLLGDPELYASISRSALDLVKRDYSWDGRLKPFAEILDR